MISKTKRIFSSIKYSQNNNRNAYLFEYKKLMNLYYDTSLRGLIYAIYTNNFKNFYYFIDRTKYYLINKPEVYNKVLNYSIKNKYPVNKRSSYFMFVGFLLTSFTVYFIFKYYFRIEFKVINSEDLLPQNNIGRLRQQARSNINEDKILFSSIIGIQAYKDELLEIISFFKDFDKYQKAGAYLPKGILMTGPPGVGKTLLAKALSNECNCNFIYKSGGEFNEIYKGSGGKAVRELFKEAKAKSPCIIFIDEIDSIAGKRSKNSFEPRDGLNQLLSEMDGFKQTDKIIVIACTNLPDSLDKAILRAGRFDRTINIPYPDKKTRKELFYFYLKKIRQRINQTVVDTLANKTIGMTGADIKNICNTAILNCIKHNKEYADKEDFDFAVDSVIYGINNKHRNIGINKKFQISVFESGKFMQKITHNKKNIDLAKVSILNKTPKNNKFEDSKKFYTKNDLTNKIKYYLSGKAAQEVIFGDNNFTSYCDNDINLAINFANKLYDIENRHMGTTDKSKRDEIVNNIITTNYNEIKNYLKSEKNNINKISNELLKNEVLSGNEILNIIN